MGRKGILLMKKILVITDMDSVGSGYKHICIPLFSNLVSLGYEVKILGLMYRGEEHNHPFSIIPVLHVQEAQAAASNLLQMWLPDVIIVALDIIHHEALHSSLSQYFKRHPHEETQSPRKYIAITPLENGPLCLSWAAPLYNLDAVFFISELGKNEALKVGVRSEHLQIGVNLEDWRPAFPEEKSKLREGLGIPQDAFVVLTVADNQERKNLWAAMESIRLLKDRIDDPIRYILVTREKNPYGWKLRDLSISLGITKEYMPFERGMPQQDLWALYAVSDAYLQPSKAEGLGLPVLDAMCMKVPVVATNTGALTELLEDGRGILVDPAYEFLDVWGNSKRSMIDTRATAEALVNVSQLVMNTDNGYDYISKRTWDIPAQQLHQKIEELFK